MPGPQTETGQLQDLKVLVTRPAQQADSLCRLLAGHGARVTRFPLLEIQDTDDRTGLEYSVDHLEDYDWVILISVNAVRYAVAAILEKRQWPANTRIAVIGKSSAAALQALGLSADACPEHQFDSEGLLDLPVMQQVAGLRVLIFRGNGGRETLANTLRARDALVEYVECYRRVKPDLGSLQAGELDKIISADIVLINSADSLKNLLELLADQAVVPPFGQQLLVVSQRLVEPVRQAGFVKMPLVADNATDQAVLDAIIGWQSQRVIEQQRPKPTE